MKRKKGYAYAHFAHGCLGKYNVFMGIHENTEILRANTQFYWFLHKFNKKPEKPKTIVKHVKTVCVLTSFHVLSCPMKTTKHCKTQWNMTVPNLSQLSFNCIPGNLKPLPYIYIFIWILLIVEISTRKPKSINFAKFKRTRTPERISTPERFFPLQNTSERFRTVLKVFF